MPIETEVDRFWNLLNKHLDYNLFNDIIITYVIIIMNLKLNPNIMKNIILYDNAYSSMIILFTVALIGT